jgi:hypothetical protein
MYILRIGAGQLREVSIFVPGKGAEERLLILASALAASPFWSEMPHAALVVRRNPEPLLAVIGYFDEAGEARMQALQAQLDLVLPRLKYVGYAQAASDCERLAGKLVERFGRDELQNFRFVAMPRGGYIVLGMLAYVMGLRRSQLDSHHPSGAPLVVVDDCAISGLRFRSFLEDRESPRVVFAHLYSPPELREAIEAESPSRVTCLSAHDLHDHAPERLGSEYSAWRERWSARMDYRSYWIGQPDHICFAWNEPDSSFWNAVTRQEESGWRFVPPDMCLKNRPEPGTEPLRVQIQPEGGGSLRPSDRVLFGELEEQIVIGDLETEETYLLSDVAADMWQAIVEYESSDEASKALLRSYDVDRGVLKADLHNFAEDLLSQGLLEKDG